MRRFSGMSRGRRLQFAVLGLLLVSVVAATWRITHSPDAPSPLQAQNLQATRSLQAERARKEAHAGLAALETDIVAERDPARLTRRLQGIRSKLERAYQELGKAGQAEVFSTFDALAGELRNAGGQVPEALTKLLKLLGTPAGQAGDDAR